MTIVIFIVILAVLILSHELGHFLVAKWNGIRVDEFGLGFPPRLWAWKRGETEYSINAIPFGGFVKIFGENPDDESISGTDSKRSMVNKPKWAQALVLAAGVFFNLVLAWILISIGFMSGLPTSATEAQKLGSNTSAKLMITRVLPNSPAEEAGVKPGDEIVSINGVGELTVERVQELINASANKELELSYRRGKIFQENSLPVEKLEVTPETGLAGSDRAVIGISMDMISLVHAPIHVAAWEGLKLTGRLTYLTADAIIGFVVDAFRGRSALGEVTGPVGLVGLVGDARTLGLIYILSFTALISINLAVINLVPFPALDGGRLLFLLIEKIKGSAINPKIANWLNLVGFALLLLLMAVVTVHDVLKLV